MTHDASGPTQIFFSDPTCEKLFETIVALAAEVYVLRERLLKLEKASSPQALAPAHASREAEAFVRHVFGRLAVS